MARFTLEQFEDFLKNVNLDDYRERFQKIKIVEMDLPSNIQALQTIYEQYWDNKDNLSRPLSFDEYYKIYWDTNEENIKIFWDNSGFGKNCDCFKKGLKARIYRTWASLITQIQGGYVAEKVFGEGSVKMSAELDHKNIDIQIVDPNDDSEKFRIQIKKETRRPEIARMHKNVKNENGTIDIAYVVVKPQEYNEKFTYQKNSGAYKKGDLKPFTKFFIKWNPTSGSLDMLPNGFVIFTKNAFTDLK